MDSTSNTMQGAGSTGVNLFQADWRDYEYPSTAIVEAVMAATGRDTHEIDTLCDHVDGDALDALLTTSKTDRVEVSFAYGDADVHVSSSGRIEVRTYR